MNEQEASKDGSVHLPAQALGGGEAAIKRLKSFLRKVGSFRERPFGWQAEALLPAVSPAPCVVLS